MIPACSVNGVLRPEHVIGPDGVCACGHVTTPRGAMLDAWRRAVGTNGPGRADQPKARRRGVPQLPASVESKIRYLLGAGAGIGETARRCGVSRKAVRLRKIALACASATVA